MEGISGKGFAFLAPEGDRSFGNPKHLACGASGRIFVVDEGRSRLLELPGLSFGSRGQGQGQFLVPRDLAADSEGRILVADSDNHRIVRIDDMTGAGWTAFGSRGAGDFQFEDPIGICVDGEDRIFVVDSGGDSAMDGGIARVIRFDDMSGTGWQSFGSTGKGEGRFNQPMDIALDPEGRIYVADTGNGRIVRMDGIDGSGWTEFPKR